MGFVVLSDTDFTFVMSVQSSIFVGRAATLYSTTTETTPIIGSAVAGRTLRIEGTVLGQNAGAVSLTQGGHTVLVGAEGAIHSHPNWVAVVVDGAGDLVQNFGLVSGGGGFWGTGWGSGRLENEGTIAAQRAAAVKLTAGVGANTIFNDGLIAGTGGIVLDGAAAVIVNGAAGEIRSNTATVAALDAQAASLGLVLRNLGTVRGLDDAVLGSAHADNLRNDGRIDGDVLLGAGNDVFRGREGFIDGELRGGDGNDTLLTGRGDEVLLGERGLDRLDGGAGSDTMTGGAHADVFVFSRAGAGGADLVTDFQDNVDDLDLTGFRLPDFAAVAGLARDAAGGLVLDFTALGGGTVLLPRMTVALLDAGDVLL